MADDPATVIAGTVIGGVPARILAAYCATGDLDANLRTAARDTALYLKFAAGAFTLGALVFPPGIVLAPLALSLSVVLDVLASGGTPTSQQVGALTSAGKRAESVTGKDPTESDAGKDVIAGARALLEAMGAPSEPRVSGAPSSCAAEEHARKRRSAFIAARGKAAARAAQCARSGGVHDARARAGCAGGAFERARENAQGMSARCLALGGSFDARRGGCVVNGQVVDVRKRSSGAVLGLVGAVAGFVVAGPVGAVAGAGVGLVVGGGER